MSATRSRSATTRWQSCLRSPTSGWTPTPASPVPGNWRRCFDSAVVPANRSVSGAQSRGDGLVRAEHELAVAFEVGAGAHVELAVLADEEQRALRHFLGALQQLFGIAGAHL